VICTQRRIARKGAKEQSRKILFYAMVQKRLCPD